VAHEAIHSMKSNSSPRMIIKIYMSKACEKINWDFFLQILSDFGFYLEWISWVCNQVSTIFFSILVNGSLSPTFNPSNGIIGEPFIPLPLHYDGGRSWENLKANFQL